MNKLGCNLVRFQLDGIAAFMMVDGSFGILCCLNGLQNDIKGRLNTFKSFLALVVQYHNGTISVSSFVPNGITRFMINAKCDPVQ